MSWEIAIVAAILGQAVFFVFLSNSFERKRAGLKALLILIGVGMNILLAGFLRLIIDAQTIDAGIVTKLDTLTTVYLSLSIAIFSIMLVYFVLTYTVATFKAVKNAKQEKEEMDWAITN